MSRSARSRGHFVVSHAGGGRFTLRREPDGVTRTLSERTAVVVLRSMYRRGYDVVLMTSAWGLEQQITGSTFCTETEDAA